MKKVDRGKYVSHNPYMDVPQGIGYGVTISAPHMVSKKKKISKVDIPGLPSYLYNHRLQSRCLQAVG
jgi:hypothetical protein